MANGIFEVAKNLLDPAAMLRGGGELAILGGRPVLWAGPQMGWQSPESFFKYTGPQQAEALTGSTSPAEIYAKAAKLPGYRATATPSSSGGSRGTLTPGGAVVDGEPEAWGGQRPPAAPELPPPPSTSLPSTTAPYSETTIPQEQDAVVTDLLSYLKELGDPERLRQVEDMRLQNLLKSQLLTSELTRSGERARFARDIERENIQAWKEKQIAQIQANAIQQAALGASMISAFAPPAAQALTGTLQAAMQPFANVGLKRG